MIAVGSLYRAVSIRLQIFSLVMGVRLLIVSACTTVQATSLEWHYHLKFLGCGYLLDGQKVLAAQDADQDGFPDEGQEPVVCVPWEWIAKRLTMMLGCVPTPIPE